MKKLLLLSIIFCPFTSLAGGFGNIQNYDLMKKIEAEPSPTVTEAREEIQSITPKNRGDRLVSRPRSTRDNQNYTLEGQKYTSDYDLVAAFNKLDPNQVSYEFNGKTYGNYNALEVAIDNILRGHYLYLLNGKIYSNYWDYIRAYRAIHDADAGITRVTTKVKNYGNIAKIASGEEPIDPKDNSYRGYALLKVRQQAAQYRAAKYRSLLKKRLERNQ